MLVNGLNAKKINDLESIELISRTHIAKGHSYIVTLVTISVIIIIIIIIITNIF